MRSVAWASFFVSSSGLRPDSAYFHISNKISLIRQNLRLLSRRPALRAIMITSWSVCSIMHREKQISPSVLLVFLLHALGYVWCLVNNKWLIIISLYEVLKVHSQYHSKCVTIWKDGLKLVCDPAFYWAHKRRSRDETSFARELHLRYLLKHTLGRTW